MKETDEEFIKRRSNDLSSYISLKDFSREVYLWFIKKIRGKK